MFVPRGSPAWANFELIVRNGVLRYSLRLIDSGNQWVFKYYYHVQVNFSLQTKTVLESYLFPNRHGHNCLPNIGIKKAVAFRSGEVIIYSS